MNMRLIGAGYEEFDGLSRAAAALRRMSAEQFLQLGVDQVAYVRAAQHDGTPFFLVHGADGVPLASVDALEDAVEMAAEHGFEFVTVH
ncbi:MAG TPA: DUF1150 family protein [Acetobacteraceae bacterium]|nr:DUF1150 family protein [Acetobacteraceae bacterium]